MDTPKLLWRVSSLDVEESRRFVGDPKGNVGQQVHQHHVFHSSPKQSHRSHLVTSVSDFTRSKKATSNKGHRY